MASYLIEFTILCVFRMIKSRRMRWAGHVAPMGEKKSPYRLLMRKPEVKIPIERPTPRWVDNINTDLTDIGWGAMDWIYVVQDRGRWTALVKMVMNFCVP
jgi:hypothetical protein